MARTETCIAKKALGVFELLRFCQKPLANMAKGPMFHFGTHGEAHFGKPLAARPQEM